MTSQTAQESFITIAEASELAQRSAQTIRRAVKLKKLDCRRSETPQGFSYLVNKRSLIDLYHLNETMMNSRKSAGLKVGRGKKGEAAFGSDMQKLYHTIQDLVQQHAKERENFLKIIQGFQERITILEKQLKLLQAPKEEPKAAKRPWWKLW